MSDEFDNASVESTTDYYSPFWPIALVLFGFVLWLGYQVVVLNNQRAQISSQLEQLQPTLQQAAAAQNRLVSLIKDLAQTSQKDQYAAQIMREAVQAGLLRVTPANTNAAPATTGTENTGTATAAPAPTSTNP